MKEELRDYTKLGLSKDVLDKATHLRDSIQLVIGDDLNYVVLGLKSKTITYKRGAKVINDRNKEGKDKVYTKSVENFSASEFGFFSNLNDLSKPEILADYIDSFVLIPDEVEPNAHQVLLVRMNTNKLGQIVIHKTALIFRKCTDEEKEALRAKEEVDEATSLGFTPDENIKSLASVTTQF